MQILFNPQETITITRPLVAPTLNAIIDWGRVRTSQALTQYDMSWEERVTNSLASHNPHNFQPDEIPEIVSRIRRHSWNLNISPPKDRDLTTVRIPSAFDERKKLPVEIRLLTIQPSTFVYTLERPTDLVRPTKAYTTLPPFGVTHTPLTGKFANQPDIPGTFRVAHHLVAERKARQSPLRLHYSWRLNFDPDIDAFHIGQVEAYAAQVTNLDHTYQIATKG